MEYVLVVFAMLLAAIIVGMILKKLHRAGPHVQSIMDFGPKRIMVENTLYFQGWQGSRPTFAESLEKAKQYFHPKDFLRDFERIRDLGFTLTTTDNNSNGTKEQAFNRNPEHLVWDYPRKS